LLQVKGMSFMLALEDGNFPLNYQGKSELSGQEVYSFTLEEKEIDASVILRKENGVQIGTVAVHLKNQPFRENYNLVEQAPIQLTIAFDDLPKQMCAVYQHRDWWSRPAFISSYEEIPERTQSLYLQGEKSYGYILPMVGEKTKTYLAKGTRSELTFTMTAYTGGLHQVEDLCFLLSEGEDLYEIIERVFKKACQLKRIPTKADRRFPEMFEYFGWCSWDAFYTDISEKKVLKKVQELKEKKIPVRWILLDDGWLSVKNQCLTDFRPDPIKFPKEFKNMTKTIKEETDIRWIGVWHALGGYWGGIAPESAFAQELKENLYETKNGKLIPHYEPEKGFGFWRRWYSYLRDQGIDFVKVDGQSALKNYYKNNEEIAKVAAGTHTALEGAVSMLMNGNIINCMGMAMENILNRPNSCISRNSDDFVPNEEKGFREHMLQNTYNALYHDQVYVCDWDMYWTKHPDATKHALVRAISGGPVYVSDRIGESVYEEILPLVYHDGRILRMDRCAKPTLDCIFHSPLQDQVLKLTNTVNGTGAMAAFPISETKKVLKTKLSPSEIYDLKGETFGAYHYFDRSFTIIKREDSIPVTLTEKDYALILFLPMKKGVTPIGLINKYMSAHAIKSIASGDTQTVITLVEGGIFAFYKPETPHRVIANGNDRTYMVQKKNGFYSIDLSDYMEEVVVTIE
jgi:hypothetical protein